MAASFDLKAVMTFPSTATALPLPLPFFSVMRLKRFTVCFKTVTKLLARTLRGDVFIHCPVQGLAGPRCVEPFRLEILNVSKCELHDLARMLQRECRKCAGGKWLNNTRSGKFSFPPR